MEEVIGGSFEVVNMFLIIVVNHLLDFLGAPCFVSKVLYKGICKHSGILLKLWTFLISDVCFMLIRFSIPYKEV